MKKRTIQALPAKLIDPRPVLLSGIGAWIVCLMTLLIVGVKTTAMWTAVWGIAIGLGIYVLFLYQRRALRRGDSTAQTSLPDVGRYDDAAADYVTIEVPHAQDDNCSLQ